eukprot:1105210-Rhodomonas_salina.5
MSQQGKIEHTCAVRCYETSSCTVRTRRACGVMQATLCLLLLPLCSPLPRQSLQDKIANRQPALSFTDARHKQSSRLPYIRQRLRGGAGLPGMMPMDQMEKLMTPNMIKAAGCSPPIICGIRHAAPFPNAAYATTR